MTRYYLGNIDNVSSCEKADEAHLSMHYTQQQPFPDSKVHGANMGPTWDRQEPGVPRVGPLLSGLAICEMDRRVHPNYDTKVYKNCPE